MSASTRDYRLEDSFASIKPETKRRRTDEKPRRVAGHLKPEKSASLRKASCSSMDNIGRSGSPPSKDLKFTKTGRLSKATKGERVHACDECGKVYTRAEHLRRHKKNHNPGTLPCDVPRCGRSFFREDLLQRHKQRHNDIDSSPYRRGSANDHISNRGCISQGGDPGTSATDEYVSENQVAGNTLICNLLPGDGSRGSNQAAKPFHPQPFHDLPIASKNLNPVGYRPLDELRIRHASLSSVTAYSTLSEAPWRRNSSPTQPYYGLQVRFPAGERSFDTYHYPEASRSSNSTESILLPLSTVGEESIHHAFTTACTLSSAGSAVPTVTGHVAVFGHNQKDLLSASSHMVGPEERDLLEQMQLQTPTTSTQLPDFGSNANVGVFHYEERYLSAFWQSIYPLWPVVHRPTFDVSTTSPLLKAAIVSLGAQSTGDVSDLTSARILHERCIKVLKKRTTSNSHSYRLCDMQAVVLVELYAIFKSRRPPSQPSSCFEDVFRRISSDVEAYPATAPESFAATPGYADYLSNMTPEVQREAKARLLVACYILDRQHSVFFGRKAIGCLTTPIEYLPFPQASSIWDATTEASVSNAYGHYTTDHQVHGHTYEALNVISALVQPATSPYDAFRSCYLIAGLNDVSEVTGVSMLEPLNNTEASTLLCALDHSPKTLLAYHMTMLSLNTPLRDLLAVAGESWVMAEKITSQTVYSAAQLEVSTWARANSNGSNHSDALYHALQILSIHYRSSTAELLYRDWAVFLASLVIWITSYVAQDSASRQRHNPNSSVTQNDLDHAVTSIVDAGSLKPIAWADASCILLWTQRKLQQLNDPRNCGLTNGCLDVLGKLISRGHESTWLT